MEANASVYDLLLGKLVVDKIELSEVRFNQARQTPGTVVEQVIEEKPFDPNTYKVSVEDLAKLEKYVKDAKGLKEQLEKLRNWLPKKQGAGGRQSAGGRRKPPRSIWST